MGLKPVCGAHQLQQPPLVLGAGVTIGADVVMPRR